MNYILNHTVYFYLILTSEVDKMKKQTVRFYLKNGEYMGWQYIKRTTYREIRNWLLDGNYLKVGNKIYNSFASSSILISVFK